MRKRLALIAAVALIATLVAVWVRSQRFHMTPPEIARHLALGDSPADAERHLGLKPGDIKLTWTGFQFEYTLVSAGWASLIFSQDEVTLLFDDKKRLTSVWYERVLGVDEVEEYGFEPGTARIQTFDSPKPPAVSPSPPQKKISKK